MLRLVPSSEEEHGLDPVVELILTGRAQTTEQAEELYLDEHIADVVRLVDSDLSEQEFRRIR
jgi:hypothetical protein